MVVHLGVKETAEEKAISIGRLQQDAGVAYNTGKQMLKDPYYKATAETLRKLTRALGFHQWHC